jgi:hypothetical protein
MDSQEVEPGGWLAVEGWTVLGVHPVLLKVAVPVRPLLALLDEQISAILDSHHLASHSQRSRRSANCLQFPGTRSDCMYLPQMPQPIVQEKILSGFKQRLIFHYLCRFLWDTNFHRREARRSRNNFIDIIREICVHLCPIF